MSQNTPVGNCVWSGYMQKIVSSAPCFGRSSAPNGFAYLIGELYGHCLSTRQHRVECWGREPSVTSPCCVVLACGRWWICPTDRCVLQSAPGLQRSGTQCEARVRQKVRTSVRSSALADLIQGIICSLLG